MSRRPERRSKFGDSVLRSCPLAMRMALERNNAAVAQLLLLPMQQHLSLAYWVFRGSGVWDPRIINPNHHLC